MSFQLLLFQWMMLILPRFLRMIPVYGGMMFNLVPMRDSLGLDNRGILLFDEGEGLFEDEHLDQSRPLKKDVKVAYFDMNVARWRHVTLTSNPVKRKGWQDWFNFVDEDGDAGGAFFKGGERWTLVDDIDNNDALFGAILQVDGTVVPDSATPDTTPEKDDGLFPAGGARPKIRLEASQYLSSSSDSPDQVDPGPSLDDALDWDNYGADLECSVQCEDSPFSRPSIPLDQAINLDCVLPLTSTHFELPPNRPRRSRVSALRRLLPGEVDRKEVSFLSRLNPFRKR